MSEKHPPARVVGRYVLFDEIGRGGMATVHLGRFRGEGGFSRIVAVKQLREGFANDPEFRPMFVDEARLSSKISDLHVVSTLDVVEEGAELFLVLEYVRGASLGQLLARAKKAGTPLPVDIVVAIFCDVLHGLHAAHETKDDRGALLDLVHRDVSPENILVGTDGAARVLDFGIAKAVGRLQHTRTGVVRGKIAYMAPEQIEGSVSRRTDVYATAVVLWEALVGEPLFASEDQGKTLEAILSRTVQRPSKRRPELPRALDHVVLRGLEHDPELRFASAREMAVALEKSAPRASASQVGAWVELLAADMLAKRDAFVASAEAWVEAREPAPPLRLPSLRETTVRRRTRRRPKWPYAFILALPLVALFAYTQRDAARVMPNAPSPAMSEEPKGAQSLEIPSPRPVVEERAMVAASSASAPAHVRKASSPVVGPHKSEPAAPCNPPYYFDSDGKKHFKRECI